ncbi:MAG: hypothetical protein HEQ37_05575 [Acidovorax sp.]|nr:hypothetical protein [Acidovorax sp.]
MTLILGTTELVHSRLREERLKPMLQGVMDASRNLMRLLNELIDLAALESRQVAFKCSTFSMHQLVASAVALVEPLARKKGLGVSLVTGADTVDALHVGDPERIQQVLVNLLDNAIKFSHAGNVRLHAEVSQGPASGEDPTPVWILRVEDQGIGIAPADQQRIFTLFEQVDGSATRAFEGAGLGLALCKRLVEGMGGSIGRGERARPGQLLLGEAAAGQGRLKPPHRAARRPYRTAARQAAAHAAPPPLRAEKPRSPACAQSAWLPTACSSRRCV